MLDRVFPASCEERDEVGSYWAFHSPLEMGSRFFPHLHMHRQLSGNMFSATIPEFRQVDTGEQILSRAHKDETKHQMQFIDQSGAKILLNRRHTPADAYVPV